MRNIDCAVLNEDNAINKAKIKTNAIECSVPHYTHSFSQQTIVAYQILSKLPTELHYKEKSVFMKEVNTQNFWTFELGNQEGVIIPIWIIVGFQQRDRQDSQNFNIDTFYRSPATSA